MSDRCLGDPPSLVLFAHVLLIASLAKEFAPLNGGCVHQTCWELLSWSRAPGTRLASKENVRRRFPWASTSTASAVLDKVGERTMRLLFVFVNGIHPCPLLGRCAWNLHGEQSLIGSTDLKRYAHLHPNLYVIAFP